MKRIAVIMAGGSGERFWPLSRKRKPKQLLKLNSEKTLIEESIERISGVIPKEDIFIITGELLLEPIREVLKDFPPQNVIAEPYKRNTAPCLALAAGIALAKYDGKYDSSEIAMAVLTADQLINPIDGFQKTIEHLLIYVGGNKVLATIGIKPSRPETGFGYIELENAFDYSSQTFEISKVKSFHEKPDQEKAKKFMESGRFLWNSGMFFWRIDKFIEDMTESLPEVGTKIRDLKDVYLNKTDLVLDGPLNEAKEVFSKFPDISIDYGLMEKAKEVVVAKALFDWDDIGSWDSLDRFRHSDENSNILDGNIILLDSGNSTVINQSDNKILFTGLGLENFVVVVTEDAVLVCPKDRAQEVKKIVEQIKKTDRESWL
ncbi:MAG: sugar phosphate nucleotidyltransferase [Candidatus Kapabacteria bacterium]|nr:sugar phosphate nucleotidyltransferase [Candidatus Kapabacteria bacterium]